MSSVTLIQVGDVHYPGWDQRQGTLDDKDHKLSERIKAGLVTTPLRQVLAELAKRGESDATEAFAFMGDFTSFGESKALKSALHHMSWLCKGSRKYDERPKLLLVPGNHDVAKADAIALGQNAKFDRIANWSKEALWYPPPVETTVRVSLGEHNSGRVHIFLVNTTLGSWERYLVNPVMRALVAADEYKKDDQPNPEGVEFDIAGADEIAPVTSAYDQLDTPYISAKCIQQIRTELDSIPRRDAVVIVGHHNILPQEQPRLSAYAEVLNAGFFRRFLLSLGRPIVYLHGHTHRDLIEEISSPRDQHGKITSIAAPALNEGFNELSFYFDARGNAVGLRILPWRFTGERAVFGPLSATQVACALHNGASVQPSAEARSVFLKLENRKHYNLDDVLELCAGTRQEELIRIMLELFFWRWVDLDQIARPPDEWRVFVPGRVDRE